MIDTKHIVLEALCDALEKMAFLTTLPMDEEVKSPQSTALSEIHYMGPKSGKIQILAGTEFMRLLAENMSAGQDTDQEACLDVFRELSNVTCGLMLPALSGSAQDIFDVTVPVVECEKAPGWEEFTADPNCQILNIENNLVAIKLIEQ